MTPGDIEDLLLQYEADVAVWTRTPDKYNYAEVVDSRKKVTALLEAKEPPEATGTLARNQPCGCVICVCEDDYRCRGCGAKHCGTHPIGEIPNPVYASAPSEPAEATGFCEWTRLTDDPGGLELRRIRMRAGCNSEIARGIHPVYPDKCPACAKPVRMRREIEAPVEPGAIQQAANLLQDLRVNSTHPRHLEWRAECDKWLENFNAR